MNHIYESIVDNGCILTLGDTYHYLSGFVGTYPCVISIDLVVSDQWRRVNEAISRADVCVWLKDSSNVKNIAIKDGIPACSSEVNCLVGFENAVGNIEPLVVGVATVEESIGLKVEVGDLIEDEVVDWETATPRVELVLNCSEVGLGIDSFVLLHAVIVGDDVKVVVKRGVEDWQVAPVGIQVQTHIGGRCLPVHCGVVGIGPKQKWVKL